VSTLIRQLADEKNLREAWRKLKKRPASYGIDQVTIDEFRDNLEAEIEELSSSIKSGRYKPNKLRGHPLEKGKSNARRLDKKEYRILKIPTVRDRVVQKTIELLIENDVNKLYKIRDNGVSFAYVKNGGVDKAALKIREYYRAGNAWAYKADIRKFFDEIDVAILLGKIKAALPDETLMPLIEEFLKIDIANADEVQERTEKEYEYNPMVGVAQGSPLSPMFANVFLSDIDQATISKGMNMVRYADDIVVMCKTKQEAINAHTFITVELSKIGLTTHDLLILGDLPKDGHEKHSQVQKYSGLLFLGLRFTGDKIYPSSDSFDNAIWTVRRAARNQKLSFVKKLVSIDARVQGWCASYSFTDYLDQPIMKNDKLLEDVLVKMLGETGLSVQKKKTAMLALGIEGYKTRLTRLRNEAKNPERITKRVKTQYRTSTKKRA
jgi:RNA-directed DNA polymerase